MARRGRARLLAMPLDGPFPSSSKPLFQGEAKCNAIDMKMILHFHANKTPFYKTSFAIFETRKWPFASRVHA